MCPSLLAYARCGWCLSDFGRAARPQRRAGPPLTAPAPRAAAPSWLPAHLRPAPTPRPRPDWMPHAALAAAAFDWFALAATLGAAALPAKRAVCALESARGCGLRAQGTALESAGTV